MEEKNQFSEEDLPEGGQLYDEDGNPIEGEIINEEDLMAEENIEEELPTDNTETSEIMSEEIHEELVSETPEPIEQSNYYFDDSKSFEQNLTDFFQKHRRSKLKHVPALVEKFTGKEERVMEYLNYKYVTKVNAIIRGEKSSFSRNKATQISGNESAGASTKKKSNTGLIILIIVIVLGAIAGGYFLWGYLSSHSEENGTEAVEQVQEENNATPEESSTPNESSNEIQEHLEKAVSAEDSIALIEKMLEKGEE